MPREDGLARVALPILVGMYVAFSASLVPIATDDLRMVGVFSLDESIATGEVLRLYRSGWITAPSFKYGAAFYYVPLLLLKGWGLLATVSEQTVVVVLRALGVVAGVGCILMTWSIGRAVFGRPAGLVACMMLAVNPVFLRWSVESHPDLAQLFWVLCALRFACRLVRSADLSSDLKVIGLASVCAGMAFATKYGGIFLTPVIGLAVLLSSEDRRVDLRSAAGRLRRSHTWLILLGVPAVFALTVLVVSPYVFLRFEQFRGQLLADRRILGFGHTFQASSDWTPWLGGLVSLAGPWHAAAALLGLVCLGWKTFRGGRPDTAQVILLAWIVLFTGYLMAEFNLRRARYLLPVLPCVYLFAGTAYQHVRARLCDRLPGPVASAALVAIVVAVASWGQLAGAGALYAAKRSRVEGHVSLAAGRWVADSFDESRTVFYDAYAYVPSRFRRAVTVALGMDYPTVNHLRPDVLVVRQAVAGDYAEREDVGRTQLDETSYLDRHYFYRYLRDGLIPDYELARDFGEVAVYRRVGTGEIGAAGADGDWESRVAMMVSGRRYGEVNARETMGSIHTTAGEWSEAVREFGLAVSKAGERPALRYKQAAALIRAGRLREADAAIEELVSSVDSSTPGAVPEIRHGLSRVYFEAGHLDRAIGQARDALKGETDLPVALFDLATYHLVRGDRAAADSLFSASVARYGPDPEVAARLSLLVEQGVASDPARQILRNHFGQETPE